MAQSYYTQLLTSIYGPALSAQIALRLYSLVEQYRGQIPVPASTCLSERDSILITYGDQIREIGRVPLKTLAEFCASNLLGVISGMHLLPFFPWSSDDGFSIKDYRKVDPALGDWQDVERLGHSFRLMFDAVINHASVKGPWFQAFLRDEKPYRDYFLTIEDSPDLSEVVRPRAKPLLTEFQTASGKRRVWTTFSADQADLDFHNPDVLLDIFDVVLTYVKRGAQFIRLDAIAYLWKELGTNCIHLPQTHAIIQLLRSVLDDIAPHVLLITETNVPHKENISYFGNGTNEAQLVYNFALPPLVLHTFRTCDATILSHWASRLEIPSNKATYFNFLASHDGIGLNPARGILSSDAIDGLVENALAHGGLISYKQNANATQSPYEMNINYFDALSNPFNAEPIALQVDRFMAAQAVMLSLLGIPGIYFHSLFGSRNWIEGVKTTQNSRTINRQKLERADLEAELADRNSLRSRVFTRYHQLLLQRAASSAFNPYGRQEILDMGREVFAVLRTSPTGDHHVLCLQNVSPHKQSVQKYDLKPYQTLWMENP